MGSSSQSDHAYLFLRLLPLPQKMPKPFKFYNACINDDDFHLIIEDIWGTPIRGSPMFRLVRKMKLPKAKLKEFNRVNFFAYGE